MSMFFILPYRGDDEDKYYPCITPDSDSLKPGELIDWYIDAIGDANEQLKSETRSIIHGKTTLFVTESPVDTQSAPESMPPPLAEKILILALSPKKYRDSQIGDLAEDFLKYESKHGTGFAKLWYWKEVAREVWFTIPRFIRWGSCLLVWIEELFRRLPG